MKEGMDKMGRHIIGLLVVVTLLFFVGTWSVAAAEKPPIKVGLITAATGVRAGAGMPPRETAVWAVEEINKRGGVLGQRMELVIQDDEGNEITTAELAKKVIGSDKVVAILGSTSIASNIALVKVAGEYKVPHIMFMHPDYVLLPGMDFRYSYSPWGLEKSLHLANAEFMVKNLGWKKVTLVGDTTKLGEGFQKETGGALEAAGVKVFKEQYQVTETEFTPLMLRIKNQAPDGVLIAAGTYPAPARMVTTRKRMGIEAPFAITATVPATALIDTAGAEATEGIYLLGSYLIYDPAHQSSEEKALSQMVAMRKPGVAVDYFYATGWDAIHMFAKAIETANSTEAGKIAAAMGQIKDLQGALGVHKFGPGDTVKDHTSLYDHKPPMLQIRAGKPALIGQ
jgi:branched-chain amino acid transport system substrate-binding protein